MGGFIGVIQIMFVKYLIKKATISPKVLQISTTHNMTKDPKLIGSNITYLERKSYRLIHPYIDVLVFTLSMANINLHSTFIDTNNSIDVLFFEVYKHIKLSCPLKPVIAHW